MLRLVHVCIAGLLFLAAAGCATGPLDTEGVATDLDPEDARTGERTGETVLWGGVVASAKNLSDRTRLEVVGYPLDEYSQRPDTDEPPIGRFYAYRDGYLETAEFQRGRRVTLRGRLTGTEEGRVGDAAYTYPAVEIETIERWAPGGTRDSTRFHFGIGVILGN